MRILLAEDEKSLSNALVTILKHNNYSVDAVYNGEDALDYVLSDNIYDLVILDIMMPKLDGISVLKEIRKRKISVPIIMLTAKSDIQDKILGLDGGADDYLTKPFNVEELLARIRSVTRRKGEINNNNLTFDDLTLNRSTFELECNGNKVLLTNKEYQIVELLMLHKGQMIPMDKIMDKIWGFDSNADTNVIWTYISYLRKKLTSIGSKVTIKANRNIGYSLEEKND
jgi:two-component system, OmpR family, response regulator ArlR